MPDSDAFEPDSPGLVRDILRDLDRDPDSALGALAIQYARDAELDHPVNRKPTTIAAGAVYTAGLLCNRKVTQPQVAVAAGVTEPTVRASYHDILRYCTDIETDDRDSDADPTPDDHSRNVIAWLRRLV